MPGLAAEITYAVGIVMGPYKFTLCSMEFKIEAGQNMAVLWRVTHAGNTQIDEKIVGVISSECNLDCREFFNLREFLLAGGVVKLDQKLQ